MNRNVAGFTLALFIAAVFVVDALTPLGVVVWILYLVPLLVISHSYSRTWNLLSLVLCTALILVGYLLSPQQAVPEPYLYNRLVGILLLWVVSYLVIQQQRAKAAINCLNRSLEEKVEQLEISNQDLKSFCYTVAHDIRGPLTRMSGFSHALLEDYAVKVDAQGKMYMERIIYSCNDLLGSLDSMLGVSKLSFASMQVTEVNMSEFASSIMRNLAEMDPARRVRVDIAPDLVAMGDASLLRMAMHNLLSNAWKFTGKCEDARIEFGSEQMGEETVYFVRDNGAGFDQAYVEKLFQPFQRLHTKEEFPGTGVGLASVHKIVQRHGGRIWAEGERGKGATFHFTLAGSSDRRAARRTGTETSRDDARGDATRPL